jgi:cell division protease FtsH
MNSTVKVVVFWALIVVSAWLLWQSVRSRPANAGAPEISYSTFIAQAEAGKISSVSITGTHIEGQYRDGQGNFRLTGPNSPGVYLGILEDMGAEIRFRDVPAESPQLQLLGTWAPLILLAGLWFFMVRQIRRRSPTDAIRGSLDSSGRLR